MYAHPTREKNDNNIIIIYNIVGKSVKRSVRRRKKK